MDSTKRIQLLSNTEVVELYARPECSGQVKMDTQLSGLDVSHRASIP